MNLTEVQTHIARRWSGLAESRLEGCPPLLEVTSAPRALPDICGWLFSDLGYSFAGLIVEEGPSQWELRYPFYGEGEAAWVHVLVRRPLDEARLPSISEPVHAADWHEREAEDLFGLVFEGHPRLGDFVLHDDRWQEGVEPMRRSFSAHRPLAERHPNVKRRPRRIVRAPGAFAMPIGPVFAGQAEAVHFLLETVGEDVIRAIPRLFYKYRGIEKLAEGRSLEETLLLAERFCATSAFAHALGFCLAVEAIAGAAAPARAQALRVMLAELERFRHHVAAIQAICESTALAVAASQAAMLEEDLLRLSGALSGHRYLFGLLTPGGLTRDFEDAACRTAVGGVRVVLSRLVEIQQMLQFSSSFLDRIEQVGITPEKEVRLHGLVGPVARAAGVARDLRRAQPYCGYDALPFEVPCESEGDGYARLRVLFAEAAQSVRLMEQAAALPGGPVLAPVQMRPGAAMGWTEAPRGAALHWVRIGEDGQVARYRIMPPSFANWHGFHVAAENFAFQDFPIILATFDLSVAENDR